MSGSETNYQVGDSWTTTISDDIAIQVDWKATNPVVQKFANCFTITLTASVVRTVVTQDITIVGGEGAGAIPDRVASDVVVTETTLFSEDYSTEHVWGENLHDNIYGLLPTIQAGIDKYLKQESIKQNGQGAVNTINGDLSRTLVGWRPSG